MGQTLTHGVYLPDEGERNCYSGLAANWQILDGSVGTIAEHTAALAGKAPAVHTHTKADITDFPAYGTTAGTICEGNDSRLSDARTPVAHTHSKADITDLLNSNFIPSANNSYDLGSSSYQWNNVYSKGYFYNGVAWGLNVKNTWTNFNIFNGYRLQIKHISQEIGVIPSSNQWNGFYFVDKNESQTLAFEHAFMGSGETRFKISMVDNYASHDSGSTVLTEFLRMTTYLGTSAFCIGTDASPLINNTYNLGTSTNKWKSFNGINPGALSFPNMDYSDTNKWKDIRGNITNQTGGDNWYTPTEDGWIFIIASGNPTVLNIFVKAGTASAGRGCLGCGSEIETASGARWLYCPVPKGSVARIRYAKGTGVLEAAWFVTCQGNV